MRWVAIGMLVLGVAGLAGGAASGKRASAIEETSAVEPPSRLIPLEEGRVLACWTFPLRSFDGELQRCVACEERSSDSRNHPLNLSCGR